MYQNRHKTLRPHAICVFLARITLSKSLTNPPLRVIGGAYRDRTDDPLLAKQVLSQLS
jgi:hypothetical protein